MKRKKNIKTPQGVVKIEAYLRYVINKVAFQDEVHFTRRKLEIPSAGFNIDIKDGDYSFAHMSPIIESYIQGLLDKRRINKLGQYVVSICDKYEIIYEDMWYNIVQNYILFNKLPIIDNLYKHQIFDLCYLEDSRQTELEIGGHFDHPELDSRGKRFPISIRISPYATQRDVIDYIENRFRQINDIQRKYVHPEIKLGNVRKKQNPELDQFIFELKEAGLTQSEISKRALKKFPESNLDKGSVGKKISIEKKRRN